MFKIGTKTINIADTDGGYVISYFNLDYITMICLQVGSGKSNLSRAIVYFNSGEHKVINTSESHSIFINSFSPLFDNKNFIAIRDEDDNIFFVNKSKIVNYNIGGGVINNEILVDFDTNPYTTITFDSDGILSKESFFNNL